MKPQYSILLRYHEIALKGENRAFFELKLAHNARKMLEAALNLEKQIEIKQTQSRILLELSPELSWGPEVQAVLKKVFGLSSYSLIRKVPTTHDDLIQAALEEFKLAVQENGMPQSFRVKTKRTEKVLKETSMELDRLIGSPIADAYPTLKVDLEKPDLTLGVELHKNLSYVWTRKYNGPGGLPVGSNSRILCLLSGGLDSPVAALRAMKRGADVQYIHFFGTPFVGEDALHKVEDLVRILNQYQPNPKPLLVIPFGKIQEKIALVTNPKLRTLLYRRMMIRIACNVAHQQNALALVTGESLGQVASQTLENLSTINHISTLPILRPLIAYDKEEIIREAKRFETYEISIRPGLDCCTLFSDRHPSIKSNPEILEAEEQKFSIPLFVTEAVSLLEKKWCR